MARQLDVPVPGGTLTAWQEGAGPQVILLHGGPGVSDYTDSLASELVDGYTVTRFQQRGVAPSTTTGPFDLETQMADVLAVMNEAGLETAYLIGHSWGGHLALHLAVAHEDRFTAMIPIDPLGAIGDGGLREMGETMEARVGPEQAARAAACDARYHSPDGSEADALEAFTIMWPANFASPAQALPMPPTQVSLACNEATFDSIFSHFAAGTLAEGLPGVRLPTVFVLGRDSPLAPRHNIATADLMPNARYQIQPTGHLVWREQPGVIRRVLDDLVTTTTG